jgi:hypothetical protein
VITICIDIGVRDQKSLETATLEHENFTEYFIIYFSKQGRVQPVPPSTRNDFYCLFETVIVMYS